MWRNKNIWILMSAECVAGLGMWFGVIGNLEFLQQSVESDFLKSVILVLGLFVGLFLGPLAGRVIDQHDKKKILFHSGIVRIISVLAMFLAIQFTSVVWLIVSIILIGAAAAFYFPALQALIPLIVKEQDLLQVNGIHMNVSTISRIFGTALAGVLLITVSLFMLYLLQLIAYVLILVFTLFLQTNEVIKEKESKRGIKGAGFKEVLPVIKGSPVVLMSLFIMLVPILFLGGFNLNVIAISELQDDSTIKGFIYTVEGISFILGAALAKRLTRGRNLVAVLLSCTVVMAFAHMSLVLAEIKWASLASFGLFGLAAGVFFPIAATLFQREVPKEFHGRFFSFRGMMDRVLFQVIMLAVGLLLDLVGFKMMIMSLAGCAIILTVIFLIRQLKSPVTFVQNETVSASQ